MRALLVNAGLEIPWRFKPSPRFAKEAILAKRCERRTLRWDPDEAASLRRRIFARPFLDDSRGAVAELRPGLRKDRFELGASRAIAHLSQEDLQFPEPFTGQMVDSLLAAQPALSSEQQRKRVTKGARMPMPQNLHGVEAHLCLLVPTPQKKGMANPRVEALMGE